MKLSSDYRIKAKIEFILTVNGANISVPPRKLVTTLRRYATEVAGKVEVYTLDNVDGFREIDAETFRMIAERTSGGLYAISNSVVGL